MISIVVPARNGAPMTANCLKTMLHTCQVLQLPAQLILIDDASDPNENMLGVFRDIKRQATGHDVLIMGARSRLHYTGVFAAGLHFARHENIFFLSNDMAVTPYFLMAVLGVAALSARFGIVRGTSNWVDSHTEHMIEPPKPLPTYGDVAQFSARQFERLGLAFVEDRMLSGDAVLVKRSVVEKIGVMDCRFFGYFGDVDFGMRAHLAGFQLVCAKGAWLHHQGAGHIRTEAARSGRAQALLNAERMKLVEAAYQVFREKWDPSLPASVSEVGFNDYNAFSERAPLHPELRCDLPSSVLENLIVD